VKNESEQVGAVDRRVSEPDTTPVAVGVQAPAADLHDRTGPALVRQGVLADLPGHRGRVLQRIVEGIIEYIQAGTGRKGIGRVQRVELLDGSVGIDHDERARLQPESVRTAPAAEDKLDHLTEHADRGLLLRCRVPAVEYGDQPVRVASTWWRVSPVRVGQEEIDRRRGELKQRFVSGHGVVSHIDRAQDAAVYFAEFGRIDQLKAAGHVIKAAGTTGIVPVPPGGFGVAIQADPDTDAELLEHLQHRAIEESAVSLYRKAHLIVRYFGTEQFD
jgi:hypothetical protein